MYLCPICGRAHSSDVDVCPTIERSEEISPLNDPEVIRELDRLSESEYEAHIDAIEADIEYQRDNGGLL